jgi:Putative beta-barrel porin-2, OmpL-like. bbp2
MAQMKRKTAPNRVTLALLASCTGIILSATAMQAQDQAAPTPAATTAPAAAPAAPAAQAPAAAAAAPAAPTALSTPAIEGPLSGLPPLVFDAGPLGKLSMNGVLSGYGLWQGYPVSGDAGTHAALTNGQIMVQKADGWFQWYVQAGAYDLPSVGSPFASTTTTMTGLYGAVPVAFAKFVKKNTSVQIGALPTMIGAEYSFTFQNMNVERGLLWNQEPVVSRGIQVNQTMGKFTASLSWNDGFYSNKYTWLAGTLAYTNGPHAISFVAGGNLKETSYQTFATPVQNNGSIYNLIYTYTKGRWIINPYFQYTDVPTNLKAGIAQGGSTVSGAILASAAFKHGFSLPVRWEYIASKGTINEGSVNLLYGPGSSATSFTVTPTYQSGGFFARGDFSIVHAIDATSGFAFGPSGANETQPRAAVEIGFIFGNNIVPK